MCNPVLLISAGIAYFCAHTMIKWDYDLGSSFGNFSVQPLP